MTLTIWSFVCIALWLPLAAYVCPHSASPAGPNLWGSSGTVWLLYGLALFVGVPAFFGGFALALGSAVTTPGWAALVALGIHLEGPVLMRVFEIWGGVNASPLRCLLLGIFLALAVLPLRFVRGPAGLRAIIHSAVVIPLFLLAYFDPLRLF